MPKRLTPRLLMTITYFLLLILIPVDSILLSPATQSLVAILVLASLKVLPLLAFSPWLWRRDSASPMGLCLVLLVYLCVAAMNAFLPGLAGHLAQLCCLLVTGLIGACLMVVRRPRMTAH